MTRSIPDLFIAALMLGIAFHLATLIPTLGQSLVARLLRMPYKTIRVGFGPQLLAWTDRAGTRWQVNALPFWINLGAVTEKQCAHSPLKRALLAASWPLSSLLLALGVLVALALISGAPGGSARIHDVRPQGPAASAGLRPGDIIRKVDDLEVKSLDEALGYIRTASHAPLVLDVERDNHRIMLPVLPSYYEEMGAFGMIFIHGDIGLEASPVCPARSRAVELPLLTLELTARVLFGSVPDVECVSVGIGATWPRPLQALGFLALISALAGVLDLLPLPGSGGTTILSCLIEQARGSAPSTRSLRILHLLGYTGFAALVVLVLRGLITVVPVVPA